MVEVYDNLKALEGAIKKVNSCEYPKFEVEYCNVAKSANRAYELVYRLPAEEPEIDEPDDDLPETELVLEF
jgi:hypothetical protein